MFKNTAQKLTVFAFADAGHASLDAGEPVTGDAANITCKVEQDDDGIRTAVADTNPTETEDGQYVFDVTAAECNGDKLTWYPESATAGVQVVAWPSSVIYTRPANFTALAINASGHVERVVLTDTTTTNTDMRGTDGANTTAPPTAAAIADAVWDEPFADHNSTSTTFGYVVHNSLWDVTASLSRVLEDTDELQTNQGQWATATGFSTFNAASDNVIVNDLTAAALAKFLTEDTGETVAADGSVGKIAQGSAGGNVTVGDITTAALAKFASTDSGESTAVTGSVAKLSQGSGGGSGTVVVLPSAAVVPDRSDKKKLQLFTGETITQSISVYEYDETTAVDLTGESLEVVFETEDGTDITVVASGDITIGGASNNVVSFATPAAVTNRQRVCLYAIRRESDGYVFGHGNAVVTRVAGADA